MLCEMLEKLTILWKGKQIRIKCFLDKSNIKPGDEWQNTFVEALKRSVLFLPITSHASLEKTMQLKSGSDQDNCHVERHLGIALAEKKRIAVLPLLLGDVEVSECGERILSREFDFSKYDGGKFPNVRNGEYKAPAGLTKAQIEATVQDTMVQLLKFQAIVFQEGFKFVQSELESVCDKIREVRILGVWCYF